MWGKIAGVTKKMFVAKNTAQTLKESSNGLAGLNPLIKMALIPAILIGAAIFGTVLIIAMVLSSLTFHDIYGATNESAYADTGSSNAPANWEELFYYQWQGPWADIPYDASGNTIGQAGCGLVSITHCIDLLVNKSFTPDEISNQLREYYGGNVAAYAPGGSYVPKLVEFATDKYGLVATHYTDVGEALKDLSTGNKVLICSDNNSGANFINGNTGNMYSANHVIMCYKSDGENCWVKDSGEGGNAVKYTKEQLGRINFVGFTVLSKEG